MSKLYISETTAGAIYPNSHQDARFACRHVPGEGRVIKVCRFVERDYRAHAEDTARRQSTNRLIGKSAADNWSFRKRHPPIE